MEQINCYINPPPVERKRVHLRMLAAYTVLRRLDQTLPAIPGTNPDISEEGNRDFYEIHAAATKNVVPILTNMVEAFKKPDSYNIYKMHPCMAPSDLAEFQFFDQKALAQFDPDHMIAFRSRRGYGYINAAACVNRPDILALVLKQGMNPDAPSPNGFTPLHEALIRNHTDCVALLLRHDADGKKLVPSHTHGSQPPLHTAAATGALNTCRVLLDNGIDIWTRAPEDVLKTAAHVCPAYPEVLRMLLDKDPRLGNARCAHERTPLHYAVWSRESTDVLLDHGADVNAVDLNGNTPLHLATLSSFPYEESRRRLFPRRKFSWHQLDHVYDIRRIMSAAFASGHPEWRRHLIRRGADPDICNSIGLTPDREAFIQVYDMFGETEQDQDLLSRSQYYSWLRGNLNPHSAWASLR